MAFWLVGLQPIPCDEADAESLGILQKTGQAIAAWPQRLLVWDELAGSPPRKRLTDSILVSWELSGKEVIHNVVTYDTLKKRLEDERNRIVRDLQQLEREEVTRQVGPASETDTYGNHLADNATDTYEAEKALALENHLRGVLGAVEEALRKFDAGQYGVCQNCGKQIDPERLEALPYTTLCLSCKKTQEKEAQAR